MLQQSMRLRSDELDIGRLAVQQEEQEVPRLCDRPLLLVSCCHLTHFPFGSWFVFVRGLNPQSISRMWSRSRWHCSSLICNDSNSLICTSHTVISIDTSRSRCASRSDPRAATRTAIRRMMSAWVMRLGLSEVPLHFFLLLPFFLLEGREKKEEEHLLLPPSYLGEEEERL